MALLDGDLEVLQHALEDLGAISRPERLGARPDPRVGQQIVDQRLHPGGAFHRERNELASIGVELILVAALQQLGVAGDHAQRLLQVMRGHGGELFQFLVGAFQLLGLLGQCLFHPLALDELADLASHHGKHAQQILVRLFDALAKELDDSHYLSSGADGEAESAVQPFLGGQRSTREVWVDDDVGNPGRFTGGPNAAGQADAGWKGAPPADRGELGNLHDRLAPEFDAAEHVGGCIHLPDGAEVPAQTFADLSKDERRGRAERLRLRQGMRHHVLHGQAALGPFAQGDVTGDAKRAHDAARLVAQALLGRRYPSGRAIGPGFLFLAADQRLAGANDLLLIVESPLRVIRREKIKVPLANRLLRRAEIEEGGHGFVDPKKAALAILEIDVVGDRVQQPIHQISLGGQGHLRALAPVDLFVELAVALRQCSRPLHGQTLHLRRASQGGGQVARKDRRDQQSPQEQAPPTPGGVQGEHGQADGQRRPGDHGDGQGQHSAGTGGGATCRGDRRNGPSPR